MNHAITVGPTLPESAALEHSRFNKATRLSVKGATWASGIGPAVNHVVGIGGSAAASRRVRGCMSLVPKLFKRQRHGIACSTRGDKSQKGRFSELPILCRLFHRYWHRGWSRFGAYGQECIKCGATTRFER